MASEEWDWFHYEELVDEGWGCVWRSFQNAIYRLVGRERRASVIPLDRMVEYAKIRASPLPFRSVFEHPPFRWIEPAHIRHLGECMTMSGLHPSSSRFVAVIPSDRSRHTSLFLKTEPTNYEQMVLDPGTDDEEGIRAIYRRLCADPERTAIVFDDGIMGLCLVSLDGGATVTVVDPHHTKRAITDRVLRNEDDFWELCRYGAMMAIITRH